MRDYFSVLDMARGDQGPIVQTNTRVYELDFEADVELWSTELYSGGSNRVPAQHGQWSAARQCRL